MPSTDNNELNQIVKLLSVMDRARLALHLECWRCRWVAWFTSHGYRLKAAVLKKEFERGGALQHLLLRYTQALIAWMTQVAQTAVCNRHHSVGQHMHGVNNAAKVLQSAPS